LWHLRFINYKEKEERKNKRKKKERRKRKAPLPPLGVFRKRILTAVHPSFDCLQAVGTYFELLSNRCVP